MANSASLSLPEFLNLLSIAWLKSKCFFIEYFDGLVIKIISSIPISIASSTIISVKNLFCVCPKFSLVKNLGFENIISFKRLNEPSQLLRIPP